MTYRIKNMYNSTLRMFHAKGFKYPRHDRDDARNDAIMTRLFRDTQEGIIKGFYLVSNDQFKAYHRSPKKAGFIQFSVGFYRDGELIPTYDVQMQTAKDMIREGYESGHYKVID